MLASGYRISHHLRECHPHHRRLGLALGQGLDGARIVQLSSLLKPRAAATGDGGRRSRNRLSASCFGVPSQSRGGVPILSDCFSQQENAREPVSEGSSLVAGGIVALGKFDALHIGHRELAIQASKVGTPFLLSFVGMAEVLGWEPRIPIVAKSDRQRVLSSWASYCGNVVPIEFQIEFATVRYLSPEQFVEKLSKELGVRGVVAGENYRFGYKAAGDALELSRLCRECGMGAYIIKSIMDKNQEFFHIDASDLNERGQVSSTRVRHALAAGDMNYVSELLGRRHRLVIKTKGREVVSCPKHCFSAPKSCLLNLAPKDGVYNNCYIVNSQENLVPCGVVIDTRAIHVQMDESGVCDDFGIRDFQLLHIEFGDSRV
ncbi:FAD synthetase 2, chloroplastic-like isoform X1 [Rhodamnia argentea]|uniref:FAD synthase n=1 Tax=Rhodamnia argentea TaxID=178133 RepID=A0A8B8QJK0_9MYRT|nr:FAD synthetase 2, chloroplastic-like isoform X1 [Rhodamnia argentea]